jgi:nucleotide-binding universal stress UspA family protein
MSEIKNVLVATDFSTHSEAAVRMATLLAKTFNATVHLVHAFDTPIPIFTPYEVVVPDGFLEQARDSATRSLHASRDKIQAESVTVKAHLTEGPAASAIARAAEELGADLIVMGTRGNTGLKHVVLGSVAERTIRLAPCSVLTVKSPDE